MNQKDNFQVCNHQNCSNDGLYKAPLHKLALNTYQWFCLEHIKAFNKSWDFHKEMDIDEIELEIRRDSTWRRPTRPFGSGTKFINFEFENQFNDSSSKANKKTNKLIWSLEQLDLSIKSTVEEIKKNYKNLAKRYHPDAKSGIKNSDEKFRDLVEAYTYLMDYHKKVK
ncbi:MAG: DnaJ domain-containing protein [Proteobacteria bacterium]|nr:DnaJ domain-containing protein [Pseudomonadota bacterium]